MSLHRCTEPECPFLGQATTRGCRCHKTDEQVLRIHVAVLLEALKEMVNRWEPDTAGADRRMWEDACEAIAMAEGQPTEGR